MIHRRMIEQEWREENLAPFDELILSWNGARPILGNYSLHVSVKLDDWSPWFLYACWGDKGQKSFSSAAPEVPALKVYQDTLEVLDGKKATGFQVKIIPEGNASLDNLYWLHVYTNGDRSKDPAPFPLNSPPLRLQIKGLSQIALNHVRHRDLCSPTSTAAVVRFLSNNSQIDPIEFALKSWDGGFDIFGNWVFNVAEASAQLGPNWNCWVERLNGFADIYEQLKQGIPVIVSVKGPLIGGALPYESGHLIVVTGYTPNAQEVLCMDPAFASDELTHVSYKLSDFINAWDRRGRVAYLFNRSC